MALHPGVTAERVPASLRASTSAVNTWHNKLRPTLQLAILQRSSRHVEFDGTLGYPGEGWRPPPHPACASPARAHSASDLRGELEEERGEGTAASAYCTSASHVRSLAPSTKRVLVLFSGPYSRPDSLKHFLEQHGFEVTVLDNDPIHGDAADDLLLDRRYHELRRVGGNPPKPVCPSGTACIACTETLYC